MLREIFNSPGTVVISLLLAGLVTLIVLRLRGDRKRGRSSCCGGKCGCCPMASSCHRQSQ